MSRSASDHAAGQLEYRVFTATRPGLTPDIPAGYESLAWVANSSTLIYGARDAVLVDTFLTIDQSAQLADEVAASGKNLTHVYITHGHGDHFFGLDAIEQRFPNVRAVATAAVIDHIAGQLEPDMLDGFWRQRFPGQIPDDPSVPEPLDGLSIELEGRDLIPIETGYTDTADSTSLHVPSIGLIAAGDVVYNGIHPYQVSPALRRGCNGSMRWTSSEGSALAPLSPGTRSRGTTMTRMRSLRPASTSVISSGSIRRPILRASCSTR
ncbi:MAG TPA: MBL fold metallo-hydrolase [Trebonia sp.]|jgi:glyoxylase-like metal-dependent hydrolase (beta-lactamase superfamily II)|nr:MBL fold metallo-hydrolase [Trebonia sp.]